MNRVQISYKRVLGRKRYELTNHLGNVLAVISDKRICVASGGTTLYYNANPIMEQDYYPFGSEEPGRIWTQTSKSNYRFNFNDKEHDDETYGPGNEYNYGARVYDPRIERFLSVDPLSKKYPMLTPYQFASNIPISGIDLDGLEYYYSADGSLLGQGGDPASTEVRLAKIPGKTNDGGNIYEAVDLEGKSQEKFLVINSDHDEFKRLAGVLYAEGASTWKESAGICSVLKNRAELNNTTVGEEASAEKGVYGASHSDEINSKTANKTNVANAYKGLIYGSLSSTDYSGGGYFWDGKDFNGENKSHGGYNERYKPGYHFAINAHDLWGQLDNKKSGKTKFGSWDFKYESTGAEGNTTFSKLSNDWRDAQYPGDKKANELGK